MMRQKNIKFFILFIGILGLSIMIGYGVYSEKVKKSEVCLYTGSGAELAEDVEFALNELEIPYSKVNEDDIKKGNLKNYLVLIIPGGYTKRAVSSLGKKGFEMIRRFVADGGGYIGICAGAYLASQRVEIPGRPQGLGIIDIKNIRKKGIGMRKIYLKEHPITEGLKREVAIRYQNGPEILIKGEAKEAARYKDGSLAIATASSGKGKVVIFSPHPEGSITQGIKPKPATLKLLKNSIEFCIRADKHLK
ncbi:MAG: BPL-N domain-containing protein [Candidatus Aerophobetes bacterium]|nr:BPL-N domain-containing protein [Candidatus Aerophobetes bacterium]